MSVEKMKMKLLLGKAELLNDALGAITSLGFVHLENASSVMADTRDFSPLNEQNQISAVCARVEETVKLCGVDPETVEPLPGGEGAEADRVLSGLNDELHALQNDCTALQERIRLLEEERALLKHFSSLDVKLEELRKTEFVEVRFGCIPADSYEKLLQYGETDSLQYVPCSTDKDFCWLLYLSPRGDDDADRIFASLFFRQADLPEKDGTPSAIIASDAEQIYDLHVELHAANDRLVSFFQSNRGELLSLYGHLKYQNEVFALRRYACLYRGNYAALVCWVPEERCGELEAALRQVDSFTVSDLTVGGDAAQGTPPTRLRNWRIFRPFQYFVEMYGSPSYHEVDPTPFVALTYTLLYGIMFADVGQGILLAIAGYCMYRFFHNPVGRILIPCGLCGTVFGFLFGSVFGYEELLDPVYRAIGLSGKPFSVMDNANTLLALSIGIGVVLLLLAMCIGICSSCKKRNYGNALFGANGAAGIILYLSLLCLIVQVFDISVPIPGALLATVGVLLPVCLVFFHAPLNSLLRGEGFRLGESVGDYVIENLFELIEVFLSYFTNTLSFLRVGAFVLIHAGMMMAFSALAEIVGGGALGVVMMVIGNVFVTVLEGLLVAIQVLRLEFYEMFSRFYDGDGKQFSPAVFRRAKSASKLRRSKRSAS